VTGTRNACANEGFSKNAVVLHLLASVSQMNEALHRFRQLRQFSNLVGEALHHVPRAKNTNRHSRVCELWAPHKPIDGETYLLDFLAAALHGPISVELKGEQSAGQLRPLADDQYRYRYIIMPMRI
jgi:hypothetical protein